MGIGTRVKAALKENKMTIKALAEKTGIPANTLYSITKRDDQNVRSDNLDKIADALGVSLDYLHGREAPQLVTLTTPDGQSYQNDALIRFPKGHPFYVPTLQEMEAQKDELLEHFDNLNDAGREKTVEYAKDLTVNPLYQRKKREK